MVYAVLFLCGFAAGLVVTWMFAQSAINDYKAAVKELGFEFKRVQGVIQAVRKAL